MTGTVTKLNGHGPTSLEAWQEYSAVTITLTDQLAVKVRRYDVLSLLNQQNLAKMNPLLQVLQQAVDGKDAANVGKSLLKSPESLGVLSEILNEVLVQVIIEPPLLEQPGHDSQNAISVNHIPIEFKFRIFMELIGGMEKLTQLVSFQQQQAAGVVAPRPGK